MAWSVKFKGRLKVFLRVFMGDGRSSKPCPYSIPHSFKIIFKYLDDKHLCDEYSFRSNDETPLQNLRNKKEVKIIEKSKITILDNNSEEIKQQYNSPIIKIRKLSVHLLCMLVCINVFSNKSVKFSLFFLCNPWKTGRDIGGIVIAAPLERPPVSHQHQGVSVLENISYDSK